MDQRWSEAFPELWAAYEANEDAARRLHEARRRGHFVTFEVKDRAARASARLARERIAAVASWKPGMPAPPGYMEVEIGTRQTLRIAVARERPEIAPGMERGVWEPPFEPATEPGEMVVWTIASPIPIIIMGQRS